MKKIWLTCLFLVIFNLIVPQSLRASDATSSSSLQDALRMDVTYDLPYPGILPDSPFYLLKAFRDKLVSFFITDAQKQAEFDLLQADKRLVAAQYLLKEPTHSNSLVSTTVSKAENYFDESITNIAEAKKEGRLVNDFLDRLNRAGIKHLQVLYIMKNQSSGQLRADLEGEIQRVQNFEQKVTSLKSH